MMEFQSPPTLHFALLNSSHQWTKHCRTSWAPGNAPLPLVRMLHDEEVLVPCMLHDEEVLVPCMLHDEEVLVPCMLHDEEVPVPCMLPEFENVGR